MKTPKTIETIQTVDLRDLKDVTGGCAACGGNCAQGASTATNGPQQWGARAGQALGQRLGGLFGRR